MHPEQEPNERRIRLSVRPGPYQYVRVGADGTSVTIPVSRAEIDAGFAEATVEPDDIVMEIALKSTSDPDLDPARGQLWPEGTDA